jgi:hypothetical protein
MLNLLGSARFAEEGKKDAAKKEAAKKEPKPKKEKGEKKAEDPTDALDVVVVFIAEEFPDWQTVSRHSAFSVFRSFSCNPVVCAFWRPVCRRDGRVYLNLLVDLVRV